MLSNSFVESTEMEFLRGFSGCDSKLIKYVMSQKLLTAIYHYHQIPRICNAIVDTNLILFF